MKFKKVLLLIIPLALLMLANPISAETYFSITLDYDAGDLLVNNIKLVESEQILDFSNKDGEYTLSLKSFKDKILFQTTFDIDTTIYSAPPEEWFDEEGNQIVIPDTADEIQIDKTSKVIFAPYFTNIRSGVIEKDEKVILSIDLEEYSICNENNICDGNEDVTNCSSDCKLSFWQRLINFLKSIFR